MKTTKEIILEMIESGDYDIINIDSEAYAQELYGRVSHLELEPMEECLPRKEITRERAAWLLIGDKK